MDQTSHTRLLLCSRSSDSVLALQREILRNSGYEAVVTASKDEIQQRIENTDFDVIILNHTLSFADRKALARKAKQRNPNCGVMVLHNSGSLGNPCVDLAVDSRAGVQPMLQTLKRIEAMQHVRTHHGAASEGKYVVVADLNRNFAFATDSACELLGYDRAMFLELRIDDVVDGSTHVTEPLFHEFIVEGQLTGRITLRHRSGKKVPIRYWSSVEPDGCAIARWEPLDTAASA